MKKYYFLYSVLFLVFLILFYLSFNSNLRRSVLGLPIGLINNYYSITISQNLITGNKGVNEIIKKIDQQIKVTDFITTNSKNTFTDNIYDNLYKIEKYIINENDKDQFSNVVEKLIERDPNIYDALIWDAKLLSYKNAEKGKVINRINSAIELSPSSHEAYRFILDFANKNDDQILLDFYCEKYHTSVLGGRKDKQSSLFRGSSITRFAIQAGDQNDNINIFDSISLNETVDYELILKKKIKLNSLNILSNFLPGTLINIESIELTNISDQKMSLSLKDIYMSSENSFFLNSEDKIKIFTTNYQDENIKLKFLQTFDEIINVKLKIKINKANLTNKEQC